MRLNLAIPRLGITPGTPTPITVEVFNDDDVIDGYRLEVLGLKVRLPNGEELTPTVEVMPVQLSIFPDTTGVITALITLPQGYPAGLVLGELRVHSVSDADEVGVERIHLDVAESPGFTMLPVPQSITGGRRAIFGLVLDNTGNVPLELALTVTDAENVLVGPAGTELRSEVAPVEEAVGPDVQPPQPPPPPFLVSLAPRERADVRLPVSAPRPVLGTPVTRIVTFEADPGPDATIEPVQAVGTLTQRPLIPRFVLTILTILLALGLWGALLLIGVDRTTDKVAADNAALASQQDAAALADSQAATAGVIAGTVTDVAGNPVGDATVAAAGDGEASATSLTDGDVGAFELSGLPVPGAFTITVTGDGFASRTVPFELTEDAPTARGLTLVVSPITGTITGTVTDEAGNPLPGVSVTATGTDGSPGGVATTATSGSVGYYELGGLAAPGEYTVTFTGAGRVEASRTVEVPAAGGAVPLDVTLLAAPSARVSGSVGEARLQRPACTPSTCRLESAAVTVTDAEGTVVGSTLSDSAGAFTVSALRPGDYKVSVAKEGYATQVVPVTLVADGTAVIDVVLVGLPGSISGVAPGCQRVEVRLRNLEELNPPRTAQPAGADGVFGVAELPTPGEYRVVFFGNPSGDFRDVRVVDITLGPGENRVAVTASCDEGDAAT
jgi:Carboxypeptidase regulatory-like domain